MQSSFLAANLVYKVTQHKDEGLFTGSTTGTVVLAFQRFEQTGALWSTYTMLAIGILSSTLGLTCICKENIACELSY